MAENTVNFLINIDGNAYSGIVKLDDAFKDLTVTAKSSLSFMEKIGGFSLRFNMLSDAAEKIRNSLDSAIEPGVKFDSSLRELSAITGVAGKGLEEIGEFARENAKNFGGNAAQSLESYKLLLSQLAPEIAKSPEALRAMGESVSVLSKSMGGDAIAAAETLTTAMNQYGIDLTDPIAASKTMSEMMNVMSAAANAGSAELPQIKQALEQAGMAAKGAGVSFEETNAAIQLLDKAGKKGSEGGIALRNTMMILSRGRFLPKDVKEELAAAGVNVEALGNKNLSLVDRLSMLKGVSKDSALFVKLFGMENSNAAMALVNGTDTIKEYTAAVSGTNDAYDFAKNVMGSYEERQARIQARFDDLKISIFNATGDMGLWAGVIASSLTPLAQLVPLLAAVGKGISWIRAVKIKDTIATIINSRAVRAAGLEYAFMKAEILGASMANLGFIKSTIRATWAIMRFATIGIFNLLKSLVLLPFSLAASGAAFGTFATTASVACKAVSLAIASIPIVGWIAIAIAAIAGLFVWLNKKFDIAKKWFEGFGSVFVMILGPIGMVVNIIMSLIHHWESIKTAFTDGGIIAGLKRIGFALLDALLLPVQKLLELISKIPGLGGLAGKGAQGIQNIRNALDKMTYVAPKPKTESKVEPENPTIFPTNNDDGSGNSLTGLGSSAGKAGKIKNINITIDKVIEKFEIRTTSVKESTADIRKMVADAIIESINDVNLAA
ncbi:MAG: phage tail tape measure protein [Prevotellaceae bacterium]|jgi:TP901 family phage tail tape measure protein|nr:phage tail tape measure protein [Prevotellaceae bacterium]